MPASETQAQWFAAYTRHQHEKVVARMIHDKGIESWLPLYSTVSRWKDRTKHLELPLFPGYVFLRTGLDRRLAILETPSVHFLVGGSDGPSAIPDAEIEAVRRALTSRRWAEPCPFLNEGDRVRVKAGPLEGIEGILVRRKKEWRLVLSVEMLQKSVSVDIDAALVEGM